MLNAFFGKVVLPSSLGDPHWVGLCTAVPHEDESEIYEVSGSGYGRTAVYAADWNEPAFDIDGYSFVANASVIIFPEASGDWGTITNFALFNLQTSGIMYLYGALTVAKAILSGSIPKFVAGALKVYTS